MAASAGDNGDARSPRPCRADGVYNKGGGDNWDRTHSLNGKPQRISRTVLEPVVGLSGFNCSSARAPNTKYQ
eukprot:12880904-Prorocentrum_lima.AAC.1